MASVWPVGHTEMDRFAEVQAMHGIIGIEAFEALQMLNWLYGKGDLASLTFDRESQRGVATLYVLHGTETARFRIIDNVVHYKGRHRKFKGNVHV